MQSLRWKVTTNWKVVWASCALQRLVWIDRGSWVDLSGELFRWEPDHHQHTTLSQGNGPTVGNTTRLPLPSITLGSPLCLPNRAHAHQAHLRSHSGSGCSHLLHGCPTRPEFKIDPVLFRVLVLERLRVPLPVTEARCECGAALDSKGRHRAACPHSGRLRTRALAPERTLARVCREAGASVRCNAKLVDMNVAVRANDERAVEVLTSGLPLFHGAQLAVDITLRCALTASGTPRPGAAAVDGIVCAGARADKELKYSELLSGDRCRLVVVAMETGGRWSPEAVEFVENLAAARARDATPTLQRFAFFGWRRRWSLNARHLLWQVFCELSGGTVIGATRCRGH